jgi:hypothetical protein
VRIPEPCLWPRPCRQAFWGGRSSRVNGAAFDVHPRVAMRILRHSKIAITMELYTMVPDEAPLAARSSGSATLWAPLLYPARACSDNRPSKGTLRTLWG